MIIRKATSLDQDSFSGFVKNSEPLCNNAGIIINEFSEHEVNTFLLLTEEQGIKGYIQGKGSEISFIDVSEELRRPSDPRRYGSTFTLHEEDKVLIQQIEDPKRPRYGKMLYEFYLDACGMELPGFYSHVADDSSAISFWEAMGFVRGSERYWYKAFELANKANIALPKKHVKVEILNEFTNPTHPFEANGYLDESGHLVLSKTFVGFKNSVNDVMTIAIDGKCVYQKKLKYSTEYGYRMDSLWVTFSEISINNLENNND